MKKTLIPLQDFVLVERVMHESSGIILADTVKDDSMFDIAVLATGPDVTIGVAPGDLIHCVNEVMAISTGIENTFFIRQGSVAGKVSFAS